MQTNQKPKLLEQVRNCMRLQRMSPRTIEVYIKWIRGYILHHGKRAGITKRVHPHIFRHSFATHWLEDADGAQDVVLPRLQRLLGHRKIETTMVYLHLITPTKVGSPLDRRPLSLVPARKVING